MAGRAGTAAALAVVVVLVVLVIVPALTPVRLGYVTSASMQPALSPGDGYVAVPAGDVQPGEIVVYWSTSREEYVTHRVVGETDRGFVTRGDANPTTDQESGEPPVPRSAIVGEVLTVAGRPVVVPELGRLVPLLQRYRVLLLGLLSLGVVTLFFGRRRRRTPRQGPSVLRVRDVAVPALLVVLLTLVAVAPLGSSTYQLTYVATPEGGETTLPVGESVTRNVSVEVLRMPFTTSVVRADGMAVLDRSFEGSTLRLRVSIPPPEMAGPQRIALHVRPYPATLPRATIERLDDVSPVVASLATGLAVFLPLYLLYLLLFDGERPLSVSRSRWVERLRGE